MKKLGLLVAVSVGLSACAGGMNGGNPAGN